MSNIIREIEQQEIQRLTEGKSIPSFKPGDSLKVSVRIVEGEKTRIQAYEGLCIARKGSGYRENFTVRKISFGEGVERTFPLYSPSVEKIEVIRCGRVRRAKLYYIRALTGKAARITELKPKHNAKNAA